MSVQNARKPLIDAKSAMLVAMALGVIGVVVWQAIAWYGVPDPNAKDISPASVVITSGILVFREGLEAILVLAAVTAGLARAKRDFTRPVTLGIVSALLATVATWFLAIALLSSVNAPEMDIQAFTGLLAIAVLLIVMNWFFHKIYWIGWISNHNDRLKRLLSAPESRGTFFGLASLGFTAIYREGFEIVLFLQDLRLKAGNAVVLSGVGFGLALIAAVSILTFVANKKLPYKRMLVLTGILLGGVLIVMVGESVQEMQQAGWMHATPVGFNLPGWMGMWFATFANVEGLVAQAVAATLVIGSYYLSRFMVKRSRDGRNGLKELRESEAH
jgi:high-affinity iron transporter